MARIDKVCPGNCAKCEMLSTGEVQMIPCILDQIFQRQIRIEAKLDKLIASEKFVDSFAAVEDSNKD